MARTIIGVVSSNKTDKTIVVTEQRRQTHPLYRKQYTTTRKFMAHDPKNQAELGDKVSIEETKPISARKRFILKEIIEKPVLRQDSLGAVKVDEERPASKSKVDAEPEESEGAK